MGAHTVKMQSAREFLKVIPFYSYRINNVINTATQASTATVISDNLKAAAISAITVPVSAVKKLPVEYSINGKVIPESTA